MTPSARPAAFPVLAPSEDEFPALPAKPAPVDPQPAKQISSTNSTAQTSSRPRPTPATRPRAVARAMPPMCTSAFCPGNTPHPAKKYTKHSNDLPQNIKDIQKWIDYKKGDHKGKIRTLDLFYSCHGIVQTFPLGFDPAMPKCLHVGCPLGVPHNDRKFSKDAKDLPKEVREKELAALGKRDTWLDRFWSVHGTFVKAGDKVSSA